MTRHITIFLVAFGLISCAGSEQEETPPTMNSLFIGTYTDEDSEGIYYANFEPATGALSNLQLAVATDNPSYLTSDGQYVYAVNEMVPGQGTGQITAFEITGDSALTRVSAVDSRGAYPCYISLTQSGDALLAANYGGGNVLFAGLNPGDDNPLEGVEMYAHHGTGPTTGRQEKPHAHYIRQMPGTRVVLSADLGADKIYQYQLEEGGLTLTDSLEAAPGAGPRHIDFHPEMNIIYVMNELHSTVAVYSYDQDYEKFTELQVISSLPEGYDGESAGADIHVHPSGRWLYASNRGHDSIVSFRIGEDGRLEVTGHYTEGVTWPRNFAMSPDGNHLLVASERGNSISSATIDPENGTLRSTGHSLEISKPVCLLFTAE